MFDWIILIGAITGLCLVIGSMLLLWKGAISLSEASQKEAFTAELGKQIKLTTRYPSIALFVIGLIFFVSSAQFAKEGTLKKYKLSGKVSSEDELRGVRIEVLAGPWISNVDEDDGQVRATLHPHLENMIIKIVAPGYDKPEIIKTAAISNGKISIGDVNVGNLKIKDIQPQEHIPDRQSE